MVMAVHEGDANAKPLFRDLDADEEEPELTEISSLCLRCRKDGITKILLTKIPFYKDVVVMSFACDHCHWENNELKPAATIQEKGVLHKLRVTKIKDLNRQLVKTEWASVTIPEIEFEIPSKSQDGTITNIEGILQRAIDGLEIKLQEFKEAQPISTQKLEVFLQKLEKLKSVETPFHFIMRDASGNSFLENLHAPKQDPEMDISYFERSRDENLMLGIIRSEEDEVVDVTEKPEENLENEVLEFATDCHFCHAPCVTNMKVTHIPFFKDVVIMTTVCDTCGHKTNEVQSSSGVEPLGVKLSLKISEEVDLKRDLLKSDTCSLCIPELELEIGSAAIGSRYTTVEGLIVNMKEMLENNPFAIGDSANLEVKGRVELFLTKLDEILQAKRSVTLVLDDPCGHSYMQSSDSATPDSKLIIEKYERTFEQNDDLGLNDMKLENYEEA